MARDIRTFLNSTYVKSTNNLRKRDIIQVYVEDEIDKVFWYAYLHQYEDLYNCSFRISTLQDLCHSEKMYVAFHPSGSLQKWIASAKY